MGSEGCGCVPNIFSVGVTIFNKKGNKIISPSLVAEYYFWELIPNIVVPPGTGLVDCETGVALGGFRTLDF